MRRDKCFLLRYHFPLLLIVCFLAPHRVNASPSQIRVCSENLFRFGAEENSNPLRREQQKEFLLQRMTEAECDIVALQEVVGGDKKQAEKMAHELAVGLEDRTGRRFESFVGESFDSYIRNGFLVGTDIGSIVEQKSFDDEPLPRLQPLGPVGKFLRAPLEVLLEVNAHDGARKERVFILNLHLKSKSMGFKDPTHTNYEILRMEMAEALRLILEREMKKQPSTHFLLLGDRNSDADSATAEIMSGERKLEEFRKPGLCRVDTETLVPDCQGSPVHPRALIPLFKKRRELYPNEYRGGSYIYQGRQELLDEIFIAPKDLSLVTRPSGRLAVGFTGEFYKGSDHKLVWVDLTIP